MSLSEFEKRQAMRSFVYLFTYAVLKPRSTALLMSELIDSPDDPYPEHYEAYLLLGAISGITLTACVGHNKALEAFIGESAHLLNRAPQDYLGPKRKWGRKAGV
jgi:hypothetical protein